MYLCKSSYSYTAVNHFKMAPSSSTHDILAVDILYHKLCYNKFKYIYSTAAEA